MSIETKDGRRVSRPASQEDQVTIVSAVFAVNDRDKEIDLDNKTKGKTKTIILGNVKREMAPESLSLHEGMSIQALPGTMKNKKNSKNGKAQGKNDDIEIEN